MSDFPERQIKRNILLGHLDNIIRLILQRQFRIFEDTEHCTCLVGVFDEGDVDSRDIAETRERRVRGEG